MKNRTILIISLCLIAPLIYCQGRFDKHKPNKRLEELEKIKLLEVLNLDEETTLKFFSRRNAHRERMMELNGQLDDKMDQLQEIIKNDKNNDNQQLKSVIKEYLNLETRLPKERIEFISSLSDILNEEQLARLIVFEKKFREEIRDILFRERGNRRRDGT